MSLVRSVPAWLAALGLYVVVAVLATWPLALHLASAYPAQRPDDAYLHTWNLWWFASAVLAGRNPYHTPLWYPPDGVDLYLATLAPANGALGLLPVLLTGPIVAYNVVALALIVLAGVATFLLARHVSGHTGGALVAGLAVAASPRLLGELNLGHLNVAAIYALPLAAYALLRAAEGSRRAPVLAALLIPLAALAEWQTALCALLLGGLLGLGPALAALRRRGAWGAPLRMVLAGVAGVMLLTPLVMLTARAAEQAGPTAQVGDRITRSVDLVGFVLPQVLHPLWGALLHPWMRATLWDPEAARLAALGLTVVALAVMGAVTGGRAAWPWLAATLVGVGLAVGPELRLLGAVMPLPAPYALVGELPFLAISRHPDRFGLLATLGAAVLAAFGVRWLAGPDAASGRARWAIGLAGLLVLGELWTAPFAVSPAPDAALAARVGQATAAVDHAGAILTLPYKADEPYILYHQIFHQRPIYSTAGALVRLPDPLVRLATPGFAELARDAAAGDIVEPPVDPLAALNAFHVRYVLYYPAETPERERAGYRQRLQRVLGQAGPSDVSADGLLEAWRVPVVEPGGPIAWVGSGWHAAETWTGIGTGRWLRGTGTLYLERPAARAVMLRFTAVSFARPRRLEIRAGEQVLALIEIGTTPTPVTVTLPSGQGRATLRLRTLEGTDPADQAAFGDRRPLTVGVASLQVLPGDAAVAPCCPITSGTARAG